MKLQRQVGNRAVAAYVNALALQRVKEGDGPSTAVGIIQQQLNAVGATPRLAITGRFDAATTTATKAFQKKLIAEKQPGVTEDGIVDGLTQAQLKLRAPSVNISANDTVVDRPGQHPGAGRPLRGSHPQRAQGRGQGRRGQGAAGAAQQLRRGPGHEAQGGRRLRTEDGCRAQGLPDDVAAHRERGRRHRHLGEAGDGRSREPGPRRDRLDARRSRGSRTSAAGPASTGSWPRPRWTSRSGITFVKEHSGVDGAISQVAGRHQGDLEHLHGGQPVSDPASRQSVEPELRREAGRQGPHGQGAQVRPDADQGRTPAEPVRRGDLVHHRHPALDGPRTSTAT